MEINFKDANNKLNLAKKFVLIESNAGFGNKIFDCIIGMYLKINFSYTIYYIEIDSLHTKSGDPTMIEIFPKIKDEFFIINQNQLKYINYFLKNRKIKFKINNLSNLTNYIKNFNTFNFITFELYNLVFDMFDTFDKKTKENFNINQNLISSDIITYSKTKYATIHIRYGDKLSMGFKQFKNDKEFITFHIYTREYYYEQIKIIKKLNLPIIILTDSYQIIKHFLLEKYNLINDPNIFFPDINFINSFYLLLYSSYVVLSHSTFSFSAYLLSKDYFKNKSRIYTFCIIDEFYKLNIIDFYVSKEWTIYNDDKYILNLNQELLLEMNKYSLDNNL